MNRCYHLVFTDPFIPDEPVCKYLCEKLDFEFVDSGQLFGIEVCKNAYLRSGLLPYHKVYEELILAEATKTNRNLVIPDHPRFLDSMENIEVFISSMQRIGLFFSAAWYVQNSDIIATVMESLKARGDSNYYYPDSPQTRQVIDHALANQAEASRLIDEVALKYPVHLLRSNSFWNLGDGEKDQIDQILLSPKFVLL